MPDYFAPAFALFSLLLVVGALAVGPGRLRYRLLALVTGLAGIGATFAIIENMSVRECESMRETFGLAALVEPDWIGPCLTLWLEAFASELLLFDFVALLLVFVGIAMRRRSPGTRAGEPGA